MDERVIICEELEKCKKNPYYFATKYLKIKTSNGKEINYTTRYSEEEFNNFILNISDL